MLMFTLYNFSRLCFFNPWTKGEIPHNHHWILGNSPTTLLRFLQKPSHPVNDAWHWSPFTSQAQKPVWTHSCDEWSTDQPTCTPLTNLFEPQSNFRASESCGEQPGSQTLFWNSKWSEWAFSFTVHHDKWCRENYRRSWTSCVVFRTGLRVPPPGGLPGAPPATRWWPLR